MNVWGSTRRVVATRSAIEATINGVQTASKSGRELSDGETGHQLFRSPKLASASLNASAMSLRDSPPSSPAATASQNRSRRAARPIRTCVRG